MFLLLRKITILFMFCGVFVGCDSKVSITANIDELNVQIEGDRFSLPSKMTTGAQQPSVAEFPCNSKEICNFEEITEIVLQCESSLCNPEPKTFFWSLDQTIDLEERSDSVSEFKDVIDDVVLESATYVVAENTMGVALPEVRLFWSSPNGTISTDDLEDSSKLLGTLGPFLENETGAVREVEINPEGVDALETYLKDTSLELKLHVAMDVNLEPGDPLPASAGELNLEFEIRVRVEALNF